MLLLQLNLTVFIRWRSPQGNALWPSGVSGVHAVCSVVWEKLGASVTCWTLLRSRRRRYRSQELSLGATAATTMATMALRKRSQNQEKRRRVSRVTESMLRDHAPYIRLKRSWPATALIKHANSHLRRLKVTKCCWISLIVIYKIVKMNFTTEIIILMRFLIGCWQSFGKKC